MAIKLKREAFSECIGKVAAQAGINSDQAFGVIQQVAAYGDKLRREGSENPFEAAAEELANRSKSRAIYARSDALRNALARNKAMLEIHGNGGINTAAETMRSWLHWAPNSKNNQSIESKWHFLTKTWQATVGTQLRLAGLEDVAISGDLDREVSEAWWRLNGGKPTDSVDVSAPAQKIAETLHPALNLSRARMNAAGAHIGTAIDHVTHTSWDPRQLRLAAGPGKTLDEAFTAWWDKEEPRIADKTFDHLVPAEGETLQQAKERFGRSVFEATVSGIHKAAPGLPDDGSGYVMPAYEGTRNIARGASQGRVVFWKDASSWHDHMKEYGGGTSLYANAMESLDAGARRVALMERLGTNPAGNFNQVVRAVREKYRTDIDGLKKFNSEVEGGGLKYSLSTALSYLDGTANIPKNEDWADRINQAFTWIAASKLGGVVIPHVTSAPMTVSSELTQHGVSRLDSIGSVFKAVLTGRGPAEKQEALAEAGAYAHGFNLRIGSKLQQDSGIPGYISWAAANFMRMTGLPRVLDKLQGDGVKSVLMTRLGNSVDKSFDALDANQQAVMKRYGLGPEEWDLLRNTKNDLSIEGQRYLTPKHAGDVDSNAVADILKQRGLLPEGAGEAMTDRQVQKFKWELADKYGMYLNDASERATVTPGVREKALFIRGAQPGTLEWALARSLAQFKMWPLAAWNQILMKEVAWGLSTSQKAWGVGSVLALGTAAGALRMSINDAVAGRPQRNFLEPGNLMAAAGAGGGLGIYGDMLLGEAGRGMGDKIATAFGPVGENINSLLKLASQFKSDITSQDENVRAKAVPHMWLPLAHLAVGNLPFANLIYLKGALDYMLFYHLYEAASPGWWDRTNKRLEKEQGRTMQGYSPGQGVPYGVPGINL